MGRHRANPRSTGTLEPVNGSEHALLVTHATRWAEARKRPLDADLLETVLDLVSAYDDRSPQAWPEGSATNLVLHRWPANGPAELPDATTLRDTLDTYWRFLRGTGRMTSASAAPADLVKELRRALPRMAEAAQDRSNWSQGRVLQDFGESIGISLEGAGTKEELQGRLDRVMTAWNDLPTEERFRLMPDASPKSAPGATATARIHSTGLGGLDDDDPASVYPHYRRGIPAVAAQEARASGFARRVSRLVDWLGAGRPVTRIGVLKPAVARQAYVELDLATWDRRYLMAVGVRSARRSLSAEDKAEYAAARAAEITRAGECLPLDRLWWSAVAADLIKVTSTTATRGRDVEPEADGEALMLGLTLVTALVGRFGSVHVDVLASILVPAMIAPDGEVDLAEVREARWRASPFTERASDDPELEEIWRDIATYDVTRCVAIFDDTGIWVRRGDDLTITDFGREFAVIVTAMADELHEENGV